MDCSHVELKLDHERRPIFISTDGVFFLETFNPLYKLSYQFLLAIGEPIQRPALIHRFILTKFSLYTAMVLQYEPYQIIECLNLFCKNDQVPNEVVDYILSNTKYYGSVRLFLDEQNYFLDIESKVWDYVVSQNKDILKYVSKTEYNFDSLLDDNKEIKDIQKDLKQFFLQNQGETNVNQNNQMINEFKDEGNSDEEDDQDEDEFVRNFLKANQKKSFKRIKIVGDHFEVTKAVISCNIPLIQEYDYNSEDNKSIKLDIELKPKIKVRYYQERALSNIFISQKAKSGLVILPCGAGKTVVGVVAIQRIKQSSIIICDSDISVDQWKDELERWTTVNRNRIIRLTSRHLDDWPLRETEEPIIIITTYYMLVKKRDESRPSGVAQTNKKRLYLESIKLKHWGVCIIDEVHKLPAQTFQNVLKQYKFHFKLGLTATPYREDEKIGNLFYMIGPKLYEENWSDLVEEGFLAKPYCVEIRCDMTDLWASEYHKKSGDKNFYRSSQRELLHTSNPRKFRALEYLIRTHEERGDKILVFCDRPKIIEYYGNILKYPVIYGDVSQEDRKSYLNFFKMSNKINTIFLSRVGDTAIDLPQANVGIQIGMHFKSRRQEVQRLGRIMRAKENSSGQFNAFWYTLISKQTDEVQYCVARQKCLINQGFSYEILEESELPYNKEPQKFKWLNKIDESEYLYSILMSSSASNHEEKEKQNEDSDTSEESDESEENFNIITKAVNPLRNLAIYKESTVYSASQYS